MQLRNLRNLGVVVVLTLHCMSCTIDIPPADQEADPDAVCNVERARGLLSTALINYPHYEYELSVLGEDFSPTALINKDVSTLNFYNWQENEISKLAGDMWAAYYHTISDCDVLLQRKDQIKVNSAIEEKEKESILLETTALKALCYFNLLRIFSPPYDLGSEADGIIIKTVIGVEPTRRASLKECVETLRAWLKPCLQLEKHSDKNGWISRCAVLYLLAELELYAGQYGEAEKYAHTLLETVKPESIDAQKYQDIWTSTHSDHRLFGFYWQQPYYQSIEYDASEGDYFEVNPKILFDAKDIRSPYSIHPFKKESMTMQCLGKYNRNKKENRISQYVDMIRAAGAVFISAEANTRMQRDEQAIKTINTYLSACGSQTLDLSLRGKQLLNSILDQKLKEFVGEGKNFFDLKRVHNKSLSRLKIGGKSESSSITTEDYRWTFPIPRQEYINSTIKQNRGWPDARG